MSVHGAVWAVFRKEAVDAVRDRRTLLMVLVSAVMAGPLLLVAMASFLATAQSRNEVRDVVIWGSDRAPTLVNYLQRQSYAIRQAPADYEARLSRSALSAPVVVIPANFEADLQQGELPVVEIVSDSANSQAKSGVARIERMLNGFNRERASLGLALRGVSVALLEPVQVDTRDIANAQTRSAQLTSMLPFFVMMAVLYGTLGAALDTTAGERERGSLEPLLMNPTEGFVIVLGKWAAVATVGVVIAALSSWSFLPTQWVLRSDALSALFLYGAREASLFMLALVPLAAAVAAALMAVAIRCKSFKEAQASSTLLVLVFSLMPLVTLFNAGASAPWHLWVPALAQNTLMARVLRGESLDVQSVLIPTAVCSALTLICLAFVARSLRRAATR